MIRLVLISVLICLNLGICAGKTPVAVSPRPVAVIDLSSHPGGTYMMTVQGKVNGQEGRFIFDTGGGISYVSPSFAHAVGCQPWGQITGFTLTAQRLDMPRCDGLSFYLEGQRFAAPISGVFDIMQFMPPNVPRIDGSIGLDIFAGKAVTLSLAGKKLFVESPASLARRIRVGKEVPIRIVREAEGVALAIVVGVTTPRGLAWMELDSGNGGAFVIGKHLAALLNLDPNKKEGQPVSLRLAGGIPVEGMARVNPILIMDGNIGTPFLISWDLTMDLTRGRAWLAPVDVVSSRDGRPVRGL
jgi:hypothetical protein